ncbi:MAG TPA: carbamoyl phosphate synthase large subunit, partial [Gammaproteobacteria bacterium]|nr:carbamoyl phosphate synthase large subunit [Gammaproteobacteria bacterium]
EIPNSVTQETSAFFEPALDYLVVKIPRWDMQKLKSAKRTIGTEMKSVGEVMAIGRSFPEALQKAVGMLNIGASCLADYPHDIHDPQQEISHATDRRLFALYDYFTAGGNVDEAHQLSNIDAWFLQHIQKIAQFKRELTGKAINHDTLLQAKKLGFSDKVIGECTNQTEEKIRQQRLHYHVTPYVKQIDTLAGEFDAKTNYLYLTYHATEHDIKPSTHQPILILGSGPYSIGSSVEFDWCAVNPARTIRRANHSAIIINSNPETVSTDYDESDRLYFEQLTFERVQDIADFEKIHGIVVSVGGQIANNLVTPLAKAGYPILGTTPQSIFLAENRECFSSLLTKLGIDQPAWTTASSLEKANTFAEEVGYPVLIRPSFVLSGAAMNVVYSQSELDNYLQQA